VRRRLFRCIGCGSCARACPFGVLTTALGGAPAGEATAARASGHQVAKCDLCADRTEGDPAAVPRCVAACPAGALIFADEHGPQALRVELLGGRTAGEHPFKRR